MDIAAAGGGTLGEEVSVGPGAVVEAGTVVDDRTQLRGGAYVGRDVSLSQDFVIHPNATVLDRCRIGNRVVIWSGAVIGKDGFGFVQREGRHVRIPQIGAVIIEDDVEIGALSNVARGAIDDTIIRRGVIVDDQCHIGHGTELGEYTVMVGRSGTGGSVRIGPAITHPPMTAKRIEATLPLLPEMRRRVGRLQARIERLEALEARLQALERGES